MAAEKLTLQQKFREFKGTIRIMKEAGAEFNKELIDVAYKKFAQKHLESIRIETPSREVSELEKSLYICLQPSIYSQETVDSAFEVVSAAKGHIPEGLLEKVCAHTGSDPQRFLEILDKLSVPPLREVFIMETQAGTVKYVAQGDEFPTILLNGTEMPYRAIKKMSREEVEALVKALSEHLGGDIHQRRRIFSASHKELMVAIKDYDHKILNRYFPKDEKKRHGEKQKEEMPGLPKKIEPKVSDIHAAKHGEIMEAPASKNGGMLPHKQEVVSFIKSSLGDESDAFLQFAEQNRITLSDIGIASRAIDKFKQCGYQAQAEGTHTIVLPRYNIALPAELARKLEEEHKLAREEIELVAVFLIVGLKAFTKKSAVGGKYFRKELAMKNVRTFISGKDYVNEKRTALMNALKKFDIAGFLKLNGVLTDHKEKLRGECLSLNTDKHEIKSRSLYEMIKFVEEHALGFH